MLKPSHSEKAHILTTVHEALCDLSPSPHHLSSSLHFSHSLGSTWLPSCTLNVLVTQLPQDLPLPFPLIECSSLRSSPPWSLSSNVVISMQPTQTTLSDTATSTLQPTHSLHSQSPLPHLAFLSCSKYHLLLYYIIYQYTSCAIFFSVSSH